MVIISMTSLSPSGDAASATGPSLDCSGEPWVAMFPTLGTVHVHADGSVDVDLEPDDRVPPEDPAPRDAALRHGWGEPLALVRQGFRCAWGTAMVPPDGGGCLVVGGSVHDVAVVLVELVGLGWSVLSDRIVPTRWTDGELVAFPRAAPVLMSKRRALRGGLEGKAVRATSDAVAVDVPRTGTSQPVRAFAGVGLRRPDETVLEELAGHERFSAASLVMIGGVLAGDENVAADVEPSEIMRTHLALAALPFTRLCFDSDTLGADVAELCRWWSLITADTAVMSP
jgi:hypothetical protein